MNEAMKRMEILLAKGKPGDAEPSARALRKNNFANNPVWVKDGAEAPELAFYRLPAGRPPIAAE